MCMDLEPPPPPDSLQNLHRIGVRFGLGVLRLNAEAPGCRGSAFDLYFYYTGLEQVSMPTIFSS